MNFLLFSLDIKVNIIDFLTLRPKHQNPAGAGSEIFFKLCRVGTILFYSTCGAYQSFLSQGASTIMFYPLSPHRDAFWFSILKIGTGSIMSWFLQLWVGGPPPPPTGVFSDTQYINTWNMKAPNHKAFTIYNWTRRRSKPGLVVWLGKCQREAEKKFFFSCLAAKRGGEGGKGRTTKKRTFLKLEKKSERKCGH